LRKKTSDYFYLSPVCFGFLPTNELGGTIMAMGQLFDDQRRRWEGYYIYFYPHEFAPPNPKPLSLLHIHFRGQNGEIRVYLPELRVEVKWGNLPNHEQNKIIKFVEKNKQEIMNKIENELRERKIKLY